MSDTNEFKVTLIKATEQLEADGHYDLSITLNLLAGSLITTIEFQQAELNTVCGKLMDAEETINKWDNLLTERGVLIESQKEEIELQQKAIKFKDHKISQLENEQQWQQGLLSDKQIEIIDRDVQIEFLQKENERLSIAIRNETIKRYKYRCTTCGHFTTRYSSCCQSCNSEGSYTGSFSLLQAEQWYAEQLLLSHMQEIKKEPVLSESWEARHACTLFNAPGQFSCICDSVCNEWLKSQEGDK